MLSATRQAGSSGDSPSEALRKLSRPHWPGNRRGKGSGEDLLPDLPARAGRRRRGCAAVSSQLSVRMLPCLRQPAPPESSDAQGDPSLPALETATRPPKPGGKGGRRRKRGAEQIRTAACRMVTRRCGSLTAIRKRHRLSARV